MGFYYDTYVRQPMIEENAFRKMPVDKSRIPAFEEVRESLPQPCWQNHDSSIQCYWKTWQLAFRNIHKATEENGFVSHFIATAFNDCLFMWDSAFILMFTKYGQRAFNFQRTLDNLYCKQHDDGFICREIAEPDGTDRFHRFDPSSTGPNVIPWTEWEYYLLSGDKERLRNIFPVLVSYHRWLRDYRTWPDGTYWSSGWGCGMDNQPRLPEDLRHSSNEFYHGHQAWIDICLQQVFSAGILLSMAEVLGRTGEMNDFRKEVDFLMPYINENMWDEKEGYYFDLRRDRTLAKVKSIAAFWAMISGVINGDKVERLISHLENPDEFNRTHRVPSLSADHPEYMAVGDYWRGGVWTPTNYMILRGLTKVGYDALAHEIAMNHVGNVVKVFENTGTLWENYAPESVSQGDPARTDFVGWAGVAPVAVMFEYIFGLRPDMNKSRLVWDVRLLEEHGVDKYPFGTKGTLNLKCKARSSYEEEPEITVTGDMPIEVELRWGSGMSKVVRF